MPVLSDEDRSKLIEEDGQYRVYRLSVNPDLPDMGFVGFNSSFCTVLSAEMIANWLVRYADGMLDHQPTETEMRDNIEMMLNWRRKERPAAQVYGGLCSAPFHFKHFDELLADIGAKRASAQTRWPSSFHFRMPMLMAGSWHRRRNIRRGKPIGPGRRARLPRLQFQVGPG